MAGPVQEGAAARTLPQVERLDRVEGVAAHGLRTSPQAQKASTSTRVGNGTGTGLAPVVLVSKKDQQCLPFKKALLHLRSLKLKKQERV